MDDRAGSARFSCLAGLPCRRGARPLGTTDDELYSLDPRPRFLGKRLGRRALWFFLMKRHRVTAAIRRYRPFAPHASQSRERLHIFLTRAWGGEHALSTSVRCLICDCNYKTIITNTVPRMKTARQLALPLGRPSRRSRLRRECPRLARRPPNLVESLRTARWRSPNRAGGSQVTSPLAPMEVDWQVRFECRSTFATTASFFEHFPLTFRAERQAPRQWLHARASGKPRGVRRSYPANLEGDLRTP
jgi:hypothetical protein